MVGNQQNTVTREFLDKMLRITLRGFGVDFEFGTDLASDDF
jgi:hypothetical protein